MFNLSKRSNRPQADTVNPPAEKSLASSELGGWQRPARTGVSVLAISQAFGQPFVRWLGACGVRGQEPASARYSGWLTAPRPTSPNAPPSARSAVQFARLETARRARCRVRRGNGSATTPGGRC
jgi:hypothetical protein